MFDKGNDFCQKITYRADNPEANLNAFRNNYNPRVVVTVNMIATGTDIKPLECLLFMRDVRSKNYFEQMVGRGTRTINVDDLRKVSPHAKSAKTHFVIIDTCDVTSSIKLETRDIIVDRGPSLEDLMNVVGVACVKDKDVLTTLAGRLSRLNHTLTAKQNEEIKEISGHSLTVITSHLLDAFDEDKINERLAVKGCMHINSSSEEFKEEQDVMIEEAIKPIMSDKFRNYVLNVRRMNLQIVDGENVDRVSSSGWDIQGKNNATRVIDSFKKFILEHKEEIEALGVFYGLPYKERSKLLDEVKGLVSILKNDYHLDMDQLHDAYSITEPNNKLGKTSDIVDLISMVRYELKLEDELVSFRNTVNRNFQSWAFDYNKTHDKLNEEQMRWLHHIRDHVSKSLSIELDDLEYAPFDQMGGFGALKRLFDDPVGIIEDLNKALIVC